MRCSVLDESARWLLVRGRVSAASRILSRAARCNAAHASALELRALCERIHEEQESQRAALLRSSSESESVANANAKSSNANGATAADTNSNSNSNTTGSPVLSSDVDTMPNANRVLRPLAVGEAEAESEAEKAALEPADDNCDGDIQVAQNQLNAAEQHNWNDMSAREAEVGVSVDTAAAAAADGTSGGTGSPLEGPLHSKQLQRRQHAHGVGSGSGCTFFRVKVLQLLGFGCTRAPIVLTKQNSLICLLQYVQLYHNE